MLHRHLANRAVALTTTTVLVIALSAVARGQTPQDGSASRPDSETRPLVTIIGASVSAGLAWRDYEAWSTDPDPVTFAEKQLERPVSEREYELRTDNLPFADAIQKVTAGAVRVEEHTMEQFHLAPEATLRRELSRVAEDTLLLCSVDMFFWFGYGPVARPPGEYDASDQAVHDALERFEDQRVAFELTDAFLAQHPQCTLVVGDYPLYPNPDPRLILPSFVPSPLTLETLNERLNSWAKKHERVFVYPVAEQVHRLGRNELEVEVDGTPRQIGCEEFFQLDGLHPNRHCTAYAICELLKFCRDRLPSEAAAELPETPTFDVALARVGATAEDLDYLTRVASERR